MKLVSLPGSGTRYRAIMPSNGDAFYSVLGASTRNRDEFGDDALSKFEVQVRDLGTVYNALVNEGFDWTFAHVEDPEDIKRIRASLSKAGMSRYLDMFDRAYTLFCTYSSNYNKGPTLNIGKEAAISLMGEFESENYKNNEADKFLDQANKYCIESYDWAG